MPDIENPNIENPQKCKHKLYEWQCLTCVMEDVMMRKEIREWEAVFALSQMENMPKIRNRIKGESR